MAASDFLREQFALLRSIGLRNERSAEVIRSICYEYRRLRGFQMDQQRGKVLEVHWAELDDLWDVKLARAIETHVTEKGPESDNDFRFWFGYGRLHVNKKHKPMRDAAVVDVGAGQKEDELLVPVVARERADKPVFSETTFGDTIEDAFERAPAHEKPLHKRRALLWALGLLKDQVSSPPRETGTERVQPDVYQMRRFLLSEP